MIKKLLFVFLAAVLVVGGLGFGVSSASAQSVPAFPDGCASMLGYSATTGDACNGSSTADTYPVEGCTTIFGYSATTGDACDGASVALMSMPGCTSTSGYSAVNGAPCNGTPIATFASDPGTVIVPVTPGLPVTGAGGNALSNTLLLLSSGLVFIFGTRYLVRRSSLAR